MKNNSSEADEGWENNQQPSVAKDSLKDGIADLSSLLDHNVGDVIRSFGGISADALRKALDLFLREGNDADLCFYLWVGADLDGRVDGKPALMWAVEHGSLEGVRLLVEAGARLEVTTAGRTSTALHVACERSFPEIVEFLVSSGADVNAVDGCRYRPLHIIARLGSAVLVRLLISKGADVNAKNIFDNTALHEAATEDRRENAKALLDGGARVDERGYREKTPLHCTAFRVPGGGVTGEDFSGVAELLVSRGADVNARVASGESPLHLAASSRSLNVATLLLERGADISAVNNRGETALHCAVERDSPAVRVQIAQLLISRAIDTNAEDNNGRTALARARDDRGLPEESPLGKLLLSLPQPPAGGGETVPVPPDSNDQTQE